MTRRAATARLATAGLLLGLSLVALLATALPAAAAGTQLLLRTVPAVAGVRFSLDGRTFTAGAAGAVTVQTTPGPHNIVVTPPTSLPAGMKLKFAGWVDHYPRLGRTLTLHAGKDMVDVGFIVSYPVRVRVVDPHGKDLPASAVQGITLVSSIGQRFNVPPGGTPQTFDANRVVRDQNGLVSVPIRYSARSVRMNRSNVVYSGSQNFYVTPSSTWDITALLFPLTVQVRDALFGFPIGSAVRLTLTDGSTRRLPLGSGHAVAVRDLPRGQYKLVAKGLGFGLTSPLTLSKPQTAKVLFLSWVDMGAVLLFAALFVVGLPILGRRIARGRGRRLPTWRSGQGVGPTLAIALLVGLLALLAAPAARGSTAASTQASPAASSPSAASAAPVPLLAHYYIWFDPSSWGRAKKDYPVFGRYSSGDVAVMRQQVALARKAGIDGFLVSWKDTPTLDYRLAEIARVAASSGFKLGIVFQGLDFYRRPLPMSAVRSSFSYFVSHYADNPVFDLFGKPVVIWSGTWDYTRAQIASVTTAYRSSVLVMASEKQPQAYAAVADLFDGNAYYWSSGDPLHTPGYQAKLNEFAAVVHAHGGLWFAPAAPGFDARLLGGTRVVPRRNGATLRASMNAAYAASPDAVALISWNEYSENTMVEPSRVNGSTALKTLAAVGHANPAQIPNFDSSAPGRAGKSGLRIAGLTVLGAVLLGSLVALVLRTKRAG